jgi:uncharacterized membrane protein
MKHLILFFIGGIIYVMIEVLWRGYSYSSMSILGGLCFLIIGYINEYLSFDTPLWKQCFIGSIIITFLEFVSGVILNIFLNLNIWDYSDLPLNLLGQICVPYFILWFFLSLIAIILDDFLRWKFFREEKPRYKIL